MKVLVTGASGFIGQAVVDNFLSAGHHVVVVTRNSQCPDAWQRFESNGQLTVMFVDLTVDILSLQGLAIDVVIHLAAVMNGEPAAQLSDTLRATRVVLAAMDEANITRLVGFSSISVLDYRELPANGKVDENLPLCIEDFALGPYAKMKKDQELLIKAWQAEMDRRLILLRPGIVYGGATFPFDHAGIVKSSLALLSRHDGEVPFVHVNSVAEATVLACEKLCSEKQALLSVIHLLDNELPSQTSYLRSLKRKGKLPKRHMILSWVMLKWLTIFVRGGLRLLGRQQSVPDALKENSVMARFAPRRFSNELAVTQLHWQPRRYGV